MLSSLFGVLLIVSFIEFNFILKHFLFLKTVPGKGFFNIFLASMFLVGNEDGVWGYIMLCTLAGCGAFFLLVGCCCMSSYENKDLSKGDIRQSDAAPAGDNAALLNPSGDSQA